MNRIEKQIGNHAVIHDNDQSGAMLAWRFFHPGTEVPMLIRHIDDRDRWIFTLPGSKELHAALASMKPWSFEQWRGLISPAQEDVYLKRWEFGQIMGLKQEGAAILRAQDVHVQQMVKQARKCEITFDKLEVEDAIDGHKLIWNTGGYWMLPGLALNTPMHMSEVGHELANQSGTFGLVWYVGNDLRVKCSLRSNGEYDVSSIARSFGGGGHRNAAGFEMDIATLMGWLK